MRIAYFDGFSGISGDMVLGALVDAGCPLAQIESELRKIVLPGWKISAEKVKRGALVATHVRVSASETHHHRGYSMIARRGSRYANLQAVGRGRSESSRRIA
jgi:pyridinium-3,5-bisthiocarboxylic acid mononucleotide nickel chelatase